MKPAVMLPWKDEPIVCGPKELLIRIERTKHAALARFGHPDFMALSGGRISNANRPGPARSPRSTKLFILEIRNADKCDLAAIRRPHGESIVIHTGIDKSNGLSGRRENADKAMVATIADKGEFVPIRRPGEGLAISVNRNRSGWLHADINRLLVPDLSPGKPCDQITFGRKGRRSSRANLVWRAAERNDPHTLFRATRLMRRIWSGLLRIVG